jgi:hypothetical protein
MVLTVSSALSLVIGLFVTIASAMRSIVANLISASRYQDHAASPSAFDAFVVASPASIASRSQRS